jgi:hypothetical protein
LVSDGEPKSSDFDGEKELNSILTLWLKQTEKPFPFSFDSLKTRKEKILVIDKRK